MDISNQQADWHDRYRFSKIALRHIERKFGKEIADYWIWNETPVPFSLPTWDQIAEALGR